MKIYKLSLSYDGANYRGWQIQPNTDLTIQGVILRSLKKLLNTDQIKIMASGRTDAGVHAIGLECALQIPVEISEARLHELMNSILPNDIYVNKLELIDYEYHPIRDTNHRTYLYVISLEKYFTPFYSRYVTFVPNHFEINKVNSIISKLAGRELNFENFTCSGREVDDFHRILSEFRISKVSEYDRLNFLCSMESKAYVFQISSSGFLKQMIRCLMGALIDMALGKLDENTFWSLFEKNNKSLSKRPYKVASPNGLYKYGDL